MKIMKKFTKLISTLGPIKLPGVKSLRLPDLVSGIWQTLRLPAVLVVAATVFGIPNQATWGAVLPDEFDLPGTLTGTVDTSPAIRASDGWVFFGTGDSVNSRVYAYSVTGNSPLEKWHYPLSDTTVSSPALSGDGARLYLGDSSGTFYALNANTGVLLWSYTTGGAIR